MTDPCGIVDTIQSTFNANAIENGEETGESATPLLCLGAEDTTSGAALLKGNDGKNGGISSTEEASEEQDQHKAEADDNGGAMDVDPSEETPDDNKESKKSNEKENPPKKLGGFLHKWTKRTNDDISETTEEKEDEEKEEPPKMASVSDLSDLNRKICVVTTAGLPWRTGTAVNPLARALYLTRGRPKLSVTLMIPWLETREAQSKVYGLNIFETPEEQEEWIRKYCRDRILNSTNEAENEATSESEGYKKDKKTTDDEVDNLQIRFYPAKYHALFGSIFATVDICALIPQEDADIAILEEPEHLTWFRSLPPSSSTNSSSPSASAMESMMDNDTSCGACSSSRGEEKDNSLIVNDEKTSEEDEHKRLEESAVIGWTAKFNYVVGILHTNYAAYMRQYGLGASIVTASALQALSSVCVKAYTHRLIRLSDTLPELDKSKETTCNVHGVRSEFFVIQEQAKEETTASEAKLVVLESKVPLCRNEGKKVGDEGTEKTIISDSDGGNIETSHRDASELSSLIEDDERFKPEAVYFIGKVIWAKGFDKLLEIEDLFRKETGEYFPIDVYGSGGDFEAISRAFLGRNGLAKRVASSESVKSLDVNRRDGSKSPETKSPTPKTNPSQKDQTAALLFSKEGNLRGQIDDLQTIPSNELVVEVQTCETPLNDDNDTPKNAKNYPREIIGKLGEKTKETGTGVTKAVSKISEKLTNIGFRSLYREEFDESEGNEEFSTDTGSSLASKFRFDPPKSRYELRRHSIPARFLGVKDHALLRDIPGHKIFVNLSITEVLCTTTAEALAMGKFVVIPKHPSNTFFLQFSNCLAFESKKECVEKIKFALENHPLPLSPEDRHKLTWEGANIRLFESALITEAEAEERNKKTVVFARLHMDTMKTGAFFQGLWSRGANKKSVIKEENPEEKEQIDEQPTSVLGICKI